MESCLYQGWVGHRRLEPVSNSFRYGLFFAYLDLSELDMVFSGRWFWSVERFNWASFRRSDHLRNGPIALEEAVRDTVQSQLGWRPAGPVRMLTHLRYLGYCFNPISIYYCFPLNGGAPEAILCEVHNTPWGEEYLRALDTKQCQQEGEWHLFRLPKEFHVSPFMPMEIDYEWRFNVPGERICVAMADFREGRKLFSAEMELQRREMNSGNMTACLLRWPAMTAKVILAIYWQAVRLLVKGAPFFDHQAPQERTTGRINR